MPPSPADQLLTSARGLASAGRFSEAAGLFHQVLLIEPQQAIVHSELGAALHQMQRLDEAIACYQRAIELQPNLAGAHFNLSIALLGQNRIDQGIDVLRRALTLAPQHPERWNYLGTLLRSRQKPEEAIEAYRRSVAVDARFLPAWLNLAPLLHELRRLDVAEAAYRQALAIDSSRAEAWDGLSHVLLDENRTGEAIEAARRAVALQPSGAEFHNRLGLAMLENKQFDAALTAFRQALTLNPAFTDARTNISAVFLTDGRFQEVLDVCTEILTREPNAGAYCNRAAAFVGLGRVEEAVVSYRHAIVLEPESALIHYNLALALLSMGQLEEGWKEHEWRKQVPEVQMRRGFRKPEWDGSDLTGRRILLHTEQGYGDAFQFVRFIRQVLERNPLETILLCPPELVRVFQGLQPRVRVISPAESNPVFDVQAPLMSLPYLFHTTLETIPYQVSYLHADADLSAQWRGRMSEKMKPGLKIGLVWAGRPEYSNDRARSMSLHDFDPLLALPDMQFVSLQKGPGAIELRESPSRANVLDWTDELHDFADTAALIDNLDLVIAVDTAVAHLAGAMGKPVWVLLPLASDWRWIRNRNDSLWYPTMKLFRQHNAGDWQSVVRSVADGLIEFDGEQHC